MGCKGSLESVVQKHRVERGEMVGMGGNGTPVLTDCSPFTCSERSLIFAFSAESSAVSVSSVVFNGLDLLKSVKKFLSLGCGF